MAPDPREATTERVARAATTAAREAVQPLALCEARLERAEERLDEHSARIDRVEERLARGDVHFAEIRKDLERLTDEVRGIRGILAWVGSAVGGGVLAAGGAALLWALRQGA